jgi:hypothetical protein
LARRCARAGCGSFIDLGHHPELIHEEVADDVFRYERTRPLVGVVLYAASGALGVLAAPLVALEIFFALPVFYGVTSEGLYDLPVRRRRS